MKILIRSVLRFFLFGVYHTFGRLSYRNACAVATGVIPVISLFLGKYRRTADENLARAFPLMTHAERKEIIRRCLTHVGLTVAECMYFYQHRGAISAHVHFKGLEHLQSALAQGRGVVAVTAHAGNFNLIPSGLAEQGFNTAIILKPARDKKIEEFIIDQGVKNNVRMIPALPRRVCVAQALKALRHNGILFILPDQNFGDDGRVFVPFLGRLAATGTGPSVFARRSGAAIVPMFIVRESGGAHAVIIDPPLSAPAETEEAILMQTAELAQRIEKHIRNHSGQWLWFHKRWKTRPEPGDAVFDSQRKE